MTPKLESDKPISKVETYSDRISGVGMRLIVLLGVFFCMLFGCSILSYSLQSSLGADSRLSLFLGVALQCIFAFGATALISVRVFNKKPLKFTALTSPSGWRPIVGVLLAYIIATPAMNQIIYWNLQMKLPESMSSLEHTMRNMEDAGAEITTRMLDNPEISTLIAGLLIVGLLTGICEELLFRGALQRIIGLSGRKHLAIWTAAIIFSTVHFQFFGFVPRLLLGAWFGYLLTWTSSLWTSIFAHTLNNSVVVLFFWLAARGINHQNPETWGVAESGIPWIAIASTFLFIVFMKYCRRIFFHHRQN
ncbi:MAG: CPBP family intramembrane metalloprotease [Clostridium sp.]|nr:CPBP family intramembrane metalloprotease [Prevotella sp.]MCM1428822.1 CPBP family intramembrane metalloprotease [Clostridium sp.]MCM1475197.1 CPBP family intramembrane metalloprotease [Muribaculaceae bacterium]